MKIVALVLPVFILAATAFQSATADRCSDTPYPGTEGALCRMGGFPFWTYDHYKKDCIGYKGYCPQGLNVFKTIDKCEKECKFKNIDRCQDESYSGRKNKLSGINGSVFWTYDQEKKGCFGYKAFEPKSQNLFSSLNECEKTCKFKNLKNKINRAVDFFGL